MKIELNSMLIQISIYIGIGDSGGPLLVSNKKHNKYYLAGLTSFGIGCGSSFPSVSTRVSSYTEWIEEKVWPNS